jgi:hypothetical protein
MQAFAILHVVTIYYSAITDVVIVVFETLPTRLAIYLGMHFRIISCSLP